MTRTAKYGYDVAGGTIGITAARGPVFVWHWIPVINRSSGGDEYHRR